MILDPKLFASKDAQDIEWQVKMANLLAGENSSKEEMLEVLLQIQFIVKIYEDLGIDYDEKKIKFINKSLQTINKEKIILADKIHAGMFIAEQRASNIEPMDFYNGMLSNIEVKYLKIILKKIGKRNFEKIFGDPLHEINSNIYEKVMEKSSQSYQHNHS